MPMDYSRYPKDWRTFALQVKKDAGWVCQQCGKPCRIVGESVSEFEQRLDEIEKELDKKWKSLLSEKLADFEQTGVLQYKPKRFLLTVAHLDQNPSNIEADNLKAQCAPCHLRFDLKFRSYNRRRKRERAGQLRLFDEQDGLA